MKEFCGKRDAPINLPTGLAIKVIFHSIAQNGQRYSKECCGLDRAKRDFWMKVGRKFSYDRKLIKFNLCVEQAASVGPDERNKLNFEHDTPATKRHK